MAKRYVKKPEKVKTERDTPATLFERVLRLVIENGHYDEAEPIMDYALPERFDKRPLTNYKFDFIARVNRGGSEGIYIDCYLQGKFDNSGQPHCKIGTFKTLREDVGAYKIMGNLAGALIYYCYRYVNGHLRRYTPDAELEAEQARCAKRAEDAFAARMAAGTKNIRWRLETGFGGQAHEGELEVPADATSEEIETLAKDEAFSCISWEWYVAPASTCEDEEESV